MIDPLRYEYPYQLEDLIQYPIQTVTGMLKDDLQFETMQSLVKDDLNFDSARDAIALYQENHILYVINDGTLLLLNVVMAN